MDEKHESTVEQDQREISCPECKDTTTVTLCCSNSHCRKVLACAMFPTMDKYLDGSSMGPPSGDDQEWTMAMYNSLYRRVAGFLQWAAGAERETNAAIVQDGLERGVDCLRNAMAAINQWPSPPQMDPPMMLMLASIFGAHDDLNRALKVLTPIQNNLTKLAEEMAGIRQRGTGKEESDGE